jgi:hypothetical protein
MDQNQNNELNQPDLRADNMAARDDQPSESDPEDLMPVNQRGFYQDESESEPAPQSDSDSRSEYSDDEPMTYGGLNYDDNYESAEATSDFGVDAHTRIVKDGDEQSDVGFKLSYKKLTRAKQKAKRDHRFDTMITNLTGLHANITRGDDPYKHKQETEKYIYGIVNALYVNPPIPLPESNYPETYSRSPAHMFRKHAAKLAHPECSKRIGYLMKYSERIVLDFMKLVSVPADFIADVFHRSVNIIEKPHDTRITQSVPRLIEALFKGQTRYRANITGCRKCMAMFNDVSELDPDKCDEYHNCTGNICSVNRGLFRPSKDRTGPTVLATVLYGANSRVAPIHSREHGSLRLSSSVGIGISSALRNVVREITKNGLTPCSESKIKKAIHNAVLTMVIIVNLRIKMNALGKTHFNKNLVDVFRNTTNVLKHQMNRLVRMRNLAIPIDTTSDPFYGQVHEVMAKATKKSNDFKRKFADIVRVITNIDRGVIVSDENRSTLLEILMNIKSNSSPFARIIAEIIVRIKKFNKVSNEIEDFSELVIECVEKSPPKRNRRNRNQQVLHDFATYSPEKAVFLKHLDQLETVPNNKLRIAVRRTNRRIYSITLEALLYYIEKAIDNKTVELRDNPSEHIHWVFNAPAGIRFSKYDRELLTLDTLVRNQRTTKAVIEARKAGDLTAHMGQYQIFIDIDAQYGPRPVDSESMRIDVCGLLVCAANDYGRINTNAATPSTKKLPKTRHYDLLKLLGIPLIWNRRFDELYDKLFRTAKIVAGISVPCIESACRGIIDVKSVVPGANNQCMVCGLYQCVRCKLPKSQHAYSCENFGAEIIKAFPPNELASLFAGYSQTCPSCNVLTTRNAGCNMMTCPQCDSKWCWVCYTVTPNYYKAMVNGREQMISVDPHIHYYEWRRSHNAIHITDEQYPFCIITNDTFSDITPLIQARNMLQHDTLHKYYLTHSPMTVVFASLNLRYDASSLWNVSKPGISRRSNPFESESAFDWSAPTIHRDDFYAEIASVLGRYMTDVGMLYNLVKSRGPGILETMIKLGLFNVNICGDCDRTAACDIRDGSFGVRHTCGPATARIPRSPHVPKFKQDRILVLVGSSGDWFENLVTNPLGNKYIAGTKAAVDKLPEGVRQQDAAGAIASAYSAAFDVAVLQIIGDCVLPYRNAAYSYSTVECIEARIPECADAADAIVEYANLALRDYETVIASLNDANFAVCSNDTRLHISTHHIRPSQYDSEQPSDLLERFDSVKPPEHCQVAVQFTDMFKALIPTFTSFAFDEYRLRNMLDTLRRNLRVMKEAFIDMVIGQKQMEARPANIMIAHLMLLCLGMAIQDEIKHSKRKIADTLSEIIEAIPMVVASDSTDVLLGDYNKCNLIRPDHADNLNKPRVEITSSMARFAENFDITVERFAERQSAANDQGYGKSGSQLDKPHPKSEAEDP